MVNPNFDRAADESLAFDPDFEGLDLDRLEESANESAIIPVSPETHALVEREFAAEPDEVKDALKQLIEAVKRRATVEAKSAGNVTKEAYLAALAKTRQLMAERNIDLPIDRERIDKSIGLLEVEARKNWQVAVTEAKHIGNKIGKLARKTWQTWQDR
jgi:hypothetical protein